MMLLSPSLLLLSFLLPLTSIPSHPFFSPFPLPSRIRRGLQPCREGNIFSLQVWTVSILPSFLFSSLHVSPCSPHSLAHSSLLIFPLTLNRWVLLKNVHLAPQWLVQLEKKLHSITTHSNFRLFLTMEINPKVGHRPTRKDQLYTT